MRFEIIDDGSDFDRAMDAADEDQQLRNEAAIAKALAESLDWTNCTCVEFCNQGRHPCSHSGELHQHEDDPCPVHPDRAVIG